MILERVKSSNIEAVGHEDETLVVRFKGGATYEYEGVAAVVASALLQSKSVGQEFDTLVKKRGYKYRRLSPEEAERHAILPQQDGR